MLVHATRDVFETRKCQVVRCVSTECVVSDIFIIILWMNWCVCVCVCDEIHKPSQAKPSHPYIPTATRRYFDLFTESHGVGAIVSVCASISAAPHATGQTVLWRCTAAHSTASLRTKRKIFSRHGKKRAYTICTHTCSAEKRNVCAVRFVVRLAVCVACGAASGARVVVYMSSGHITVFLMGWLYAIGFYMRSRWASRIRF